MSAGSEFGLISMGVKRNPPHRVPSKQRIGLIQREADGFPEIGLLRKRAAKSRYLGVLNLAAEPDLCLGSFE